MLKQYKTALGMQEKIGRALAAIPITPNQWTMLSLAAAIIAGILIASGNGISGNPASGPLAPLAAFVLQNNLSIGLALFALAGLMDMVDGAVARVRKEASAFGGFLDGVCDRFVEAIFLFSFMFVPLPPALGIDSKIWLASLVFLGTCMPSFIRAYSGHKGVLSRGEADGLGGVFERSERIGLVVVGLAAGILITMQLFVYAVAIASALSLVTIFQRLAMISSLNKTKK